MSMKSALWLKRDKINSTKLVICILPLIAKLIFTGQAFGQTTEYTVLELASGGVPHRLNNLGDVAGIAAESPSGEAQATIWNHGNSRRRNLGKLKGGEYSCALAINDAREVAGAGNIAGSFVPFLWTPGNGFRRIPLPAGDNCGQAFGINRYGHVVGYSSGPTGKKTFLWTRGRSVRNLPPLPSGGYSSACDINDLDEVVGTSGSAAGDRAVVWTPDGDVRDLGTLPGDVSSEASAINNSGDVVGYSKGPHGRHAFLWTRATGMRDLGVLPGGTSSQAVGIDDMGAVVGSSTSSSGDRAFIWTEEEGIRDLNDLASVGSAVVLVSAHSINNAGQILVMGSPIHQLHGDEEAGPECAPAPASSFVLTPALR